MNKNSKIKIKSRCFLINKGRVLLQKGHDEKANEDFYVPLGGGVEFGETGEEAVRREIIEELGSKINDMKRVDVVENIFTYEGESGHEIIFVFVGKLENKELCDRDFIVFNDGGLEQHADWVDVKDIINKKIKVYPEMDFKKILTSLV